MQKKPFAVIAKPVGSRCNMHCRYCYYLEKYRFSEHEQQNRMSYSLLEKLIRQTIDASPGPMVSFTWHGGEPTLAGIEFYERVVTFQKKYLPRGWQVINNLQTNGLLLDDKWCDFIVENGFDVGISIDGAQCVHDANRLDMGGNATYERVRAAVERLKGRGIDPDILCTVTSNSAENPLLTYRALRDLGVAWIQFIPVLVRFDDGSMSPESVSAEAYGRFLTEIFDEWVTHDLGKTDVQLFAETAKVWAGGRAALCWMAQTCGRVLVVEEDGGVYSCDHFVDSEHRLGTMPVDRLDRLLNSVCQTEFGNAKRDSLTSQCRKCPYLTVCGGGCLKDRFGVADGGEQGQYYLCRGLFEFFEHSKPIMEEVMRLSRLGKTPEQIMERLNKKK